MSLTAIIGYLVAALGGGTVWKVIDYWLQHRKQSHDISLDDTHVARELRDELRKDLDALRVRIDLLERDLDEERESRVRAEMNNQLLQTKVDLLIRMVNDLRAQQNLSPISSDDVLPIKPD